MAFVASHLKFPSTMLVHFILFDFFALQYWLRYARESWWVGSPYVNNRGAGQLGPRVALNCVHDVESFAGAMSSHGEIVSFCSRRIALGMIKESISMTIRNVDGLKKRRQ